MANNIRIDILKLCSNYSINTLDINTIQSIALKLKRYDMIVYLNNNTKEYISFAKNANEKQKLAH